jgi:hypothetical protein
MEMLDKAQCCKGFRKMTKNRGFATLRVSAKYTKFDIQPLYILRSKERHLRRMTTFGRTVMALLELGNQCGTHLAAMFPKQASFTEDETEWRATKKKPGKKKTGLNVMPPGKRRLVELQAKPRRKTMEYKTLSGTAFDTPIFSTAEDYEYTYDGPPPPDRVAKEAETRKQKKYAEIYKGKYGKYGPASRWPGDRPGTRRKKVAVPRTKEVPDAAFIQNGCDCDSCQKNRANIEKMKKMNMADVENAMLAQKMAEQQISDHPEDEIVEVNCSCGSKFCPECRKKPWAKYI